MRRLLAAISLALVVVQVPPAAFAAARGEDVDLRHGFSNVARKATPAVVFIQVEKTIANAPGGFLFGAPDDPMDEFMRRFFGGAVPRPHGRPGRPFVQTGQGSGFIISKDGYILTNTHVVDGAERITVRLHSGKEYPAKRIGTDDRTEIALIKIDADNLPTAELGDTAKLEIGEWVVAIGNPFGLYESLTVGVVSAKGRSGMGIADYEDFIQTDAAINPGNSGGPLLNIDGQVVGINTAIFSRSGGYMGIGFAVPIDMAVAVKEQLISDGKVTRGYLGIAMNPGEIDEEIAKSLGLAGPGGVLVADVVPGGAAAKAGVKPGDVIVELAGRPVRDAKSFRADVAKIKPGTEVKLTVVREGERKQVEATVDALPSKGAETAASEAPEEATGKIGIEVQDATAQELRQWGYDDPRGVVITDVAPGSPAEREGLRAGMLIVGVNQRAVDTVRDLHDAVRAAKADQILRLRVKTPEGARYVFIRPG